MNCISFVLNLLMCLSVSHSVNILQEPRFESEIKEDELSSTMTTENIEGLHEMSYKRINSRDIIDELKNIIVNQSLIQSMTLEDEFPHLKADQCMSYKKDNTEIFKKCQTKMFELTNHNNEPSYIKNLPTILIIGGMSGKGDLDINIILHFMKMVQNLYSKQREWYFLMNNLRILVIPYLNSSAVHEHSVKKLYLKKNSDQIQNTDKFDYERDFDIGDKSSCFESFQTQVLNQLYHKYIIIGTLFLNNKPLSLTIPRLKEVFSSYKEQLDDDFYQKVTEDLITTFNKLNSDDNKKLELTPESNTSRALNFIEWSYGGSLMKKMASEKCIRRHNNEFKSKYQKPNQFSNKSFSIELSVGHSEHDHFRGMGNEILLVDFNHPDAKKGVISAAIGLIKNYLEIMRPFVTFKKISTQEYSQMGHNDLIKVMKTSGYIKGCLEQPQFTHQNADDIHQKEQSIQLNDNLSDSTKTYSFSEDLMFLEKQNKFQNRTELNYNFECLDSWKDNQKPILSHFLRMRMNSEYNKIYNQNVLSSINLSNNRLSGIFFGKPEAKEFIISQKYANHINLYPEKQLFVQLGNLFPIKLTYDMAENKLHIDICKNIIDQYLTEKRNTYIKENENQCIDIGFVKILNETAQNKKFLDNLEILSNVDNNFFIGVFNNEQNLLNVEFGKTLKYLDKKYKDPTNNLIKLTDDNNINKQNDNSDEEEQEYNFDPFGGISEKNKNNKIINSMINMILKTITYEMQNCLSKIYFMISEKNQTISILPSVFIELLGKPVTIWVNTKKELASKELSKKNQENIYTKFFVLHNQEDRKRLNGVIVKKNPNLFKINDLPSPEQYKEQSFINPVPLSLNGLHCTNLNPVVGIENQTYEDQYKLFNNNEINDMIFFNVYITHDPSITSEMRITIWTNYKTSADHLTLQVKAYSFDIKKTSKSLNLKGLDKSLNEPLFIYSSNFPYIDLPFTGNYIQVLDDHQLLFDCFPYSHNNNFDLNHPIKMFYRIKYRLVKLKTKYILMTKESRTFSSVMAVLCSIYFIVPLLILLISGLAFYLHRSHKKERSEDEGNQSLTV